jgi:hypothetical protein
LSRPATWRARSRSWLLLSPLALVLFAGCYGSTEPATNVGSESATLNARGTANNGPATSYFDYWVAGATNHSSTNPRHWPSGASGAFSENVAGLYAGKTYLFRVCGRDDSGGSTVCAETRQFTTSAPVKDSVVGSWGESPHVNGNVDAHSGPAGQNPQGTLFARQLFDTFTGSVSCLHVTGNTATVGGVGHPWDLPNANETMLLTVVDGGPSGTDTVKVVITPGATTPPSCANALSGATDPGNTFLTVNDAP